jgi:hypothetical protein
MQNYFILLEFARQRRQDMVQQAEAERLYRQLKGNRPGSFRRIGHCLADAVRHLKAHSQSNPATPVFDQK